MKKQLYIAEKPSVAQEFAKALKLKTRRADGYLESDEAVITWCVGHLVTMSYPEEYDPALKKWSLQTLPFIPSEFKYEVIPSVAKQFQIVSSLLNREDVDTIYVCTDSGREGEYIYRLVEQKAQVSGKKRLRVWIDSQTEEEILRGIREAKDLSEYDNLSASAYLRAKEDYLMGINFSRLLTLKYGNSISNYLNTKYSVISVGRVMTCVLGMVVRREREIREFVKTPFYRVISTIDASGHSFEGEWVLTQYQPLRLNTHIGIGIPWDLDRNVGGVSVLPPYEKSQNSEWYTGTANAIYQNLEYMEQYNPEYVLILSGDHIYKMDYKIMLDYHKANNADITIAAMPVPIEEASRFGVVVTDNDNKITEFEEKPEHPKSNLASMGIYIFSWKVLKDALIKLKDQQECDFGKHVIPYCFNNNKRIFAYEYNGYWKDVGTLSSYWEANMELIDIIPIFNLYEEFWKIYTKTDTIPPQYIAKDAYIEKSIIGDGTEVYGRVYNSVIGSGVVIEEGCVIRDSIIMNNSHIGKNTTITKSIIAEDVTIGENVELGVGEEAENVKFPKIYNSGLVTIGEWSVIPDNVKVGKNTAISGETTLQDYPNGELPGGGIIIKAGDN